MEPREERWRWCIETAAKMGLRGGAPEVVAASKELYQHLTNSIESPEPVKGKGGKAQLSGNPASPASR